LSRQTEAKAFPNPARTREQRRRRPLARGVCLILAVLALWPLLPGSFTPALVPALSPFVTVGTILATRSLHFLAWLGLAVGLIVLIRRRFFCRWACPVGSCLDGAGRLGRRLGRRRPRWPHLGPWIVLAALGGACLGHPLLLWLDPLARFAGVFGPWNQHARPAVVISAAGFLAIVALGLFWPGLWCSRICPLGAFQDLLFLLPRSCRSWLRGKTGNPQEAEASAPLPRRMLLGAVAGASWVGAVSLVRPTRPRPLRPPGAVDEPAFTGVCTRCGNCVRACPSGVIERDPGRHGWATLLTPVLHFRVDYCREDCVRCTEVCPTGALGRIPAAKKADVRLGVPRVDMDVCLLAEDRECSACKSRCPYDAIRYVFSATDYTLTPRIDMEKCTGCGACEAACPAAPRKAIVICPL